MWGNPWYCRSLEGCYVLHGPLGRACGVTLGTVDLSMGVTSARSFKSGMWGNPWSVDLSKGVMSALSFRLGMWGNPWYCRSLDGCYVCMIL